MTENPRQQQNTDEGQGFQMFMMMENLIDKLKLLDYEEEFIKVLKMRPLNRHYFALQSNPGEQFFMFAALSAWLIRKCGISLKQPEEDDDPNSTIASILDGLRNLGIPVDFSPNKLKKGSGFYALQCLNSLVEKAFTVKNITFKRPVPPVEQFDSSQTVEEDEELELDIDRIEEEMALGVSDVDEDNELDVDDLYLASAFMETTRAEEIIETDVTAEAWNLELEKVVPMLKVSIKSNNSDWRSHLDLMKHHQSEIHQISGTVSLELKKFSDEIEETMRKVSKREKLLNSQFEQLLSQYRTLQEELSFVNDKYREVNVGVVERQKTLNQISESLESVKQEMEERGATMSDGSPLVHIKKAIKDIKKEICEMDISIAVAEHSIVETKLREKSLQTHLVRTSGLN
ncbi:intraflagellar transport protein 57 homolog [Halyomorpha halys]|uniref:intraflagellar transport protein 57 homolog n=1 Tax=Halyomorpha halys TaxID=286706 RepID=UPI0006D52297|nr:intraflagellar transport protein 57 homolog [Halyomorpha halys]